MLLPISHGEVVAAAASDHGTVGAHHAEAPAEARLCVWWVKDVAESPDQHTIANAHLNLRIRFNVRERYPPVASTPKPTWELQYGPIDTLVCARNVWPLRVRPRLRFVQIEANTETVRRRRHNLGKKRRKHCRHLGTLIEQCERRCVTHRKRVARRAVDNNILANRTIRRQGASDLLQLVGCKFLV